MDAAAKPQPRELAIEWSDDGEKWQRLRGSAGTVRDWEAVPNVERAYRVVPLERAPRSRD